MPMITIYHNPRCSKSRASLALVQDFAAGRDMPLNIIDYLATPPDVQQLAALQRQLNVPAREMVRDNEEEFAALALAHADEQVLFEAIAAHPRLLQRPIVVYRGRAM